MQAHVYITEKQTTPQKAKYLNQYFTKEDTYIADTWKKSSTPLVIREIQITTK